MDISSFTTKPTDSCHGAMLIFTSDGSIGQELAFNNAIRKIWGPALFWASDWPNNRFAREPLNKSEEWIWSTVPDIQVAMDKFLADW